MFTKHLILCLVLVNAIASVIQGQDTAESKALARSNKVRAAIDKAIAAQDVKAFASLVDQERFLDRIFEGIPASVTQRTTFTKHYDEMGAITVMLQSAHDHVRNGGSYLWVRNVFDSNKVRPLYRLTGKESELRNYHEWLVEDIQGEPKIIDVHIHLTGEYLSASLRRAMLPAYLASTPNSKSEAAKIYTDLSKAVELYESRDFNGAFKIYEGLPKEYRTNKSLLLLKLNSALEIGEKTSNPVMEEMQSLYPNDPCLKLCLINMHIQKKEWDKFLTSIDELEESIQDPYVSSLKVDVLMLLGRQTEAEDAIEHAIENIPEMVELHWSRLGVMLATKQNAKIASYLSEIKKRFNIKHNQVSKTTEFAQFAASPEGKSWIAANEKR